ncbi:unnamed protein product [Prunus armeniaca]
MGKLANNLCRNWERGNWPTTCAVKSSSWQGKALSDTYVPSKGTRKYLRPTRKGETRQPLVSQIGQLTVAGEIMVGQLTEY